MMGFKKNTPIGNAGYDACASYLYMDTSRCASTMFEKLIGNVVVVLTGRQAMKIVNHAIFSPLIRGHLRPFQDDFVDNGGFLVPFCLARMEGNCGPGSCSAL